MDPRNLYVLRYRKGTTGAQVSYITASNLGTAEKLGKWWCNQHINCRYITVEKAIVADEADLPPGYDAEVSPAKQSAAAKQKAEQPSTPVQPATAGAKKASSPPPS